MLAYVDPVRQVAHFDVGVDPVLIYFADHRHVGNTVVRRRTCTHNKPYIINELRPLRLCTSGNFTQTFTRSQTYLPLRAGVGLVATLWLFLTFCSKAQ